MENLFTSSALVVGFPRPPPYAFTFEVSSGSGYRLYDERLLDRLSFIKGAQRTGLKLRQIRELLEIIDRGVCPCGHTESLLSERIAEIDREVKELREVRMQLIALKDHLPSAAACNEDSDPWPCERAFIEVGSNPEGVRTAHGEATG